MRRASRDREESRLSGSKASEQALWRRRLWEIKERLQGRRRRRNHEASRPASEEERGITSDCERLQETTDASRGAAVTVVREGGHWRLGAGWLAGWAGGRKRARCFEASKNGPGRVMCTDARPGTNKRRLCLSARMAASMVEAASNRRSGRRRGQVCTNAAIAADRAAPGQRMVSGERGCGRACPGCATAKANLFLLGPVGRDARPPSSRACAATISHTAAPVCQSGPSSNGCQNPQGRRAVPAAVRVAWYCAQSSRLRGGWRLIGCRLNAAMPTAATLPWPIYPLFSTSIIDPTALLSPVAAHVLPALLARRARCAAVVSCLAASN